MGRPLVRSFTRSLLLGVTAALTAALPLHAAETPRLSGVVGPDMLQQATDAVARGDRLVELDSLGGDTRYAHTIAHLFKDSGVNVRCVGTCVSAAAYILIASGHGRVAPGARVILHQPRVAGPDHNGVGQVLITLHNALMRLDGVPDDIMFRLQQSMTGQLELRPYDMQRCGLVLEPLPTPATAPHTWDNAASPFHFN